MNTIECFTETSTSPSFWQPLGADGAMRTALAPGAICTQVQAPRSMAREAGISSWRIV
jgi:hypothetical protein